MRRRFGCRSAALGLAVVGSLVLSTVAAAGEESAPAASDREVSKQRTVPTRPGGVKGSTLKLSPEDVNDPLGLIKQLTQTHWQARRYKEALSTARTMLKLAEKLHGPAHKETAFAHSVIGHINRDLGRHRTALPAYAKSLAIIREVEGEESAQTAAAMINLAGANEGVGRVEEAETLYGQALAMLERVKGAGDPLTASAVQRLAAFYWNRRDYGRAEGYLKRHLALMQKRHGETHNATIRDLVQIAKLYRSQSRYGDAEPYYRKALAASLRANGEDHALSIEILQGLALTLRSASRFAEAERFYRRAVTAATRGHGSESGVVATLYNEIGQAYRHMVRYDDAERAFKRSLAVGEKAFGAVHRNQAFTIANLAALYRVQGRFRESEEEYSRAITMLKQVLGDRHARVGIFLDNLGVLYGEQGRYREAAKVRKEALNILEERLGPENRHVAIVLGNLANSYQSLGRHGDAARLLERSLAILSNSPSAESDPYVGMTLDSLGSTYRFLRRFDRAEAYIKRSVEFLKRAYGEQHPDVAIAYGNLATLYGETGRVEESAMLQRKAIAMNDQIFGPWHHSTAIGLTNLAGLYIDEGRLQEAMALLQRSLAISDRVLGREHPQAVVSLARLGDVLGAQGDVQGAYGAYKRGAGIVVRRAGKSIGNDGDTGAEEVRNRAYVFHSLVAAAYQVGERFPERKGELAEEAFAAAQWAGITTAAAALTQMSARFGAGDDELAELVRRQQDLARRRASLEAGLIKAVSGRQAERNDQMVVKLRQSLAETDGELAGLLARLQEDFPEYASLANPRPMSMDDIRKTLRDDELLVQYSVGTTRGYAWAVSRERTQWIEIPLSAKQVRAKVAALRCGLDDSEWVGEIRPLRCIELLGTAYDGATLPFNLEIAHELYNVLLAPLADFAVGKKLLLVPTDALTSLPFHVLVSEPAPGALPGNIAGYRDVAWLARRNAVTILPSVASLGALRRFARASGARKPFIGYGNPLLDGHAGCPKVSVPKSCPSAASVVMEQRPQDAWPMVASIQKFFRAGQANVSAVRALCPLPDTGHELRCVAVSLGARLSEVRLGAEATEADVKQLSRSRQLDDFRILHFATHGLLAGETQQLARDLAEPALVMTPPAEASAENDGLLTASEVAELQLDADWVILSACNTASGQVLGAEALSGLARAFFYAGARALLVSHWPVASSAAVKLTTGSFAELRSTPGIGRAEALRRSVVAYLSDGPTWQAHPAYWAPFIVVGEGSAAP